MIFFTSQDSAIALRGQSTQSKQATLDRHAQRSQNMHTSTQTSCTPSSMTITDSQKPPATPHCHQLASNGGNKSKKEGGPPSHSSMNSRKEGACQFSCRDCLKSPNTEAWLPVGGKLCTTAPQSRYLRETQGR
jgi:hypothetical protein